MQQSSRSHTDKPILWKQSCLSHENKPVLWKQPILQKRSCLMKSILPMTTVLIHKKHSCSMKSILFHENSPDAWINSWSQSHPTRTVLMHENIRLPWSQSYPMRTVLMHENICVPWCQSYPKSTVLMHENNHSCSAPWNNLSWKQSKNSFYRSFSLFCSIFTEVSLHINLLPA
jgi:hypothetical protein